jgi:hypothetical protein
MAFTTNHHITPASSASHASTTALSGFSPWWLVVVMISSFLSAMARWRHKKSATMAAHRIHGEIFS